MKDTAKYKKAKSTKFLLRTIKNADYTKSEIQDIFISFWKSKGYSEIETFMIDGTLEIYGYKKIKPENYRARIKA